MRKVFLTIIGVSAALTLVLGVAFAWTSTASFSDNASAGSLSVAVYGAANTSNQLYPTNNPIAVVTGAIQNNTPANPGINVYLTGGSVSSGGGYYDACYMSGSVGSINNTQVPPGGNAGGAWTAFLTMPGNAPDGCQGATIPYNVTLNVATP